MGHPPSVPVKNDQINVWVAQNIRQLMDEHGYKQASLAQKAGVSQKTVSNFLQPAQRNESASGRAPSGTLTNLAKIANALEVPAWQLTRPTSAAERELYTRIEAAYRALVGPEDAVEKSASAQPVLEPTEQQRRLADTKRLADLSAGRQSSNSGKHS
jgi:transcriptional regulator with XRE-family HTH domain